MKPLTFASIVALLLGLAPSPYAQPLDFSIDPTSPEAWRPGDIIKGRGEELRIAATDLGLVSTDDVTGFSYGNAEIEVIADYNFVRIAYSVSRGSTGINGLISRQAVLNGAAGDKFGVTIVNYRGRILVLRRPYMISDAPVHNLTPNPGESELDGMSLFLQSAEYPVYVTLSAASGYDPATIYIIRSAGGPPEVFARPVDLRLVPGDEIDALAVGTTPVTLPPPQSLGPEVVIWISLKAGSPTRSIAEARGGDGVLQVYPIGPDLAIDAPALDLGPNDELDALTGLDPGELPAEDDIIGQPGRDPVDVDVIFRSFLDTEIIATAEMNRPSSGPTAEITIFTRIPSRDEPVLITSQILGAAPSGTDFVDVLDIELASPLNNYGVLANVYVTAKVFSTGFSVGGSSVVTVPSGSTVMIHYALNDDFSISWNGDYEIISTDPTYHVESVHANGPDAPTVVGTGQSVLFHGNEITDKGNPGTPDAFMVSGNALWGSYLFVDDTLGMRDALVHIEDANSEAFTSFRETHGETNPGGGSAASLWELWAVSDVPKDLTVHVHQPDHDPETFNFPDINPSIGTGNPLSGTALLCFNIDRQTGGTTFPFVQPLISEGWEPIQVSSIVATPEGAAIAINVQRNFVIPPFLFGQPGWPQSYVLKLGATDDGNWWKSESPTITHVIGTWNPISIIPNIPDMDLDPSTGQLSILLNSQTPPLQNPYEFQMLNLETQASLPVFVSPGTNNTEGTFFAVNFDDFTYTDTQLAAFSGNNPVLFSQALSFDNLAVVNGRCTITGSTSSDEGIFQPGNIRVPVNPSPTTKPFQSFAMTVPVGIPLTNIDRDNDGYPVPAESYFGTDDQDPYSVPHWQFTLRDDVKWTVTTTRATDSPYTARNRVTTDPASGIFEEGTIETTGVSDGASQEIRLNLPDNLNDDSPDLFFHQLLFERKVLY